MSEHLTTALAGGMQTVPLATTEPQTVYLDFDGETTSYNGEIAQFDVTVEHSGLSAAQAAEIAAALNEEYADLNVTFVTERPVTGEYSTVFIGKTADIRYAGLAETIDAGNRNRSDNAFVNLDAAAPLSQIVATISHEVEHIVFGEDHGGEGLDAYAARVDIWNGQTSSGLVMTANNYYINDTKQYTSKFGSAPEHNWAAIDDCQVTRSHLTVSSGGTATNLALLEEGNLTMHVCPDTYVQGTSSGVAFNMSNGYLSGYVHNPSSSVARIHVYSGGTATDLTILSGWLNTSRGGYVSGCSVASTGAVTFRGGTVVDTEIAGGAQFMLGISEDSNYNFTSGGKQIIVQNGTLNDFEANSWLYMDFGGSANSCIINYWCGASGSYLSGTQVNAGGKQDTGLHLRSGSVATDTSINAGGCMQLSGTSTTAIRTTVHSGGSVIFSKSDETTTARDTVIESGGRMTVAAGTVTGELQLSSGAVCNVSNQTVIDFDISGRTTDDRSLFNNFDLIGGAASASYTVTVNADQAKGSYKLAENAATYAYTATVKSDAGTLGTLGVGESFNVNGNRYSLNLTESSLTLNVAALSAKSDLNGNGISDILFQYTGGNGQVGFWLDGQANWQGQGAAQPEEWEVIGLHDMNGNGNADVVMLGNVNANGVDGAFVGFYADGDTSNWQNIGYLTKQQGVDWKMSVGNLTGGEKSSVVWHSTELGILGAWTDGTDEWVSLGGGFDSNWSVAGTGDFSGTSKESVVMCYANGNQYYAIDLDGNATRLGSFGNNWELAAIGDFAGDGKDDIVVFDRDSGIIALWADGNSENWSSVGQLDASDWFIGGAGDYNGDGKDDLLVRQNSTGTLGYYASCDTDKWTSIGSGVDMNWTVVA